jgi:hypothetical protein
MNPDLLNKALDACVEYRKQLDEKTNEVARLRELLNRAIEMAEEAIRLADIDYENDKFGKVTWLKKEVSEIETESQRALAPKETNHIVQDHEMVHPLMNCQDCGEFQGHGHQCAPPEETQDGATMDEWYGGFSKIESKNKK